MCGIAGYFRYSPVGEVPGEEALRKSADSIRHRGPDESGIYFGEGIGLAHRRLSIIDLSSGQQPMWNLRKDLCVVFNGEIYNFQELKRDLESRGRRFRTHSDTEVLLEAYDEYGDDFVGRLNGMFAFALWDVKRRRLFCARDRFGVKPFFYSMSSNGVFLFASEVKALLELGVDRSLNFSALRTYLSLYYLPGERSIFSHILKLLPGHTLVVDEQGVRTAEYWDFQFNPDEKLRQPEVEEELRTRLQQSIQRQLQSDVPVGAFLSGGLDSSSIVSFVPGVSTFTIGFDDPSYDERPLADAMAARYRTRHHSEVVAYDWPKVMEEVATAFDEPFGDFSVFPTNEVCRLARKSVKVVLSGDGGDELLAGYPTHHLHRFSRIYGGLPEFMRRGLKGAVDALPTSSKRMSFDFKLKRLFYGAQSDFRKSHYLYKEIFSSDDVNHLVRPEWRSRTAEDAGWEEFSRLFGRVQHLDPLSQLLYVDSKTFMVDDGLLKTDRMSMAHSIEVRVPFLDNDFVDFCMQIPPHLKQRGFQTKRLLRSAMKDRLPEKIIRGEKKGFSPPMNQWLIGPLAPYLQELLLSKESRSQEIFDSNWVQRIVKEHQSQQRDWSRPLWALMSFELWLRKYDARWA